MELQNRPTILLVDDEVAIRNFYQLFLEHNGFSVVPASSTAEALLSLRRTSPSLALVDVFLGADNGLDLVQAIQQISPRLPVIVISGHGYDEPILADALGTGAKAFFSKTKPVNDLLSEIKTALDDPPRTSPGTH